MAQTHSRTVRQSPIFYEGHLARWLQGIGANVKQFELKAELLGEDTVDPTGMTTTVTESGAGTTEFSPEGGFVGRITTAAGENDGGNYQVSGLIYRPDAAMDFYGGVSLQINDVDQTDLFFGFASTHTNMLSAVNDGIYFESLDGSAALATVTEKDGTETTTSSVGTLVDDTNVILEMFYEAASDSVRFFVDGTQVASHTANLPDDAYLRFSIAFLTGEATANTCSVNWMRAVQVG